MQIPKKMNTTQRPVITLSVHTRVPEKYVLLDRETGDAWQSDGTKWTQAKNIIRRFDFNHLTVIASAMRPTRESND